MYKKNVSFNEENNEEISYDKDVMSHASEGTTVSHDAANNDKLSFLSKLKRTNISDGNIIPLDEFMTDYDDDGCEYFDRNIQHDTLDKTRDVIDSREYAKLDEKINKMQNYIESIKQNQDRILELLSPKKDA